MPIGDYPFKCCETPWIGNDPIFPYLGRENPFDAVKRYVVPSEFFYPIMPWTTTTTDNFITKEFLDKIIHDVVLSEDKLYFSFKMEVPGYNKTNLTVRRNKRTNIVEIKSTDGKINLHPVLRFPEEKSISHTTCLCVDGILEIKLWIDETQSSPDEDVMFE